MKLVPCTTWRPPPDHPSPEEGYRDPPRRHSSQVTFFATESLWLWEQRHLFFTAPWMHLDYPRSSHSLTGAMVECSYATWDQLSGKKTLWLEYNMGENGWLLITRIDVHTLGHGNCKASITSRISYDTSLSCLIVNTLKFPTIVFLRLFHRFEPPAQGLEPFLRQSSQHPSPEICCCQGLLMPQRVVASEVNFSGSMNFTFLRICRVFSCESKQTISTKRQKHWLVFVVSFCDKETSRNKFSLYIWQAM